MKTVTTESPLMHSIQARINNWMDINPKATIHNININFDNGMYYLTITYKD